MNVLRIDVNGTILKFASLGGKTESRVRSFWTKEPDTVSWIMGMKEGESFLDIGANVGMYSVLAGALGLRVIAVEPESLNFSALNQNIVLNDLENVTAYPIAIGEHTGPGVLHLSSFEYGRSLHTVDLSKTYRNKQMKVLYRQGTAIYSLDDFVSSIGFVPDHIKVDVDGLDDVVVRSGWRAVTNCQSLLVEIDTNDIGHQRLVRELRSVGFSVDGEQVKRHMRIGGKNDGMANHIFTREAA